MKAQHTPGPWTAKISESYSDCMIEARSPKFGSPIYIGRVYGEAGITKFKDFPENVANARLIAAAPDLLAALENLCECVLSPSLPSYQKARAAIAKARSES